MSKLAKKLGFSLGLENDAPAADITINVETDEEGTPLAGTTIDGENTVETDQVETAEAEGEVEQTNDQVEELEEAQETLENYYVALEHYNRNGGMSRETAGMMAIGVAGVTRKFGIGLEDLNISVESFGNNRQRATTVSMEGIKDMLAEIWRKIKELMFKMWKALKNFYMKLFSGAVRLKKRAEAIKKKADQETRGISEKKIEVGLLKQLHISGKVPTASQIDETLTYYQEATGGLAKGGFDKASEATITVIDDLSSMDAEKVRYQLRQATAMFEDEAQKIKATSKKAEPHQVKRFYSNATGVQNSSSSGELLGGQIALVVANVEGEDIGIKMGFTRASDKVKEVDSTGSFETLGTSQISSICNKVIDIADNVRLYEKVWDKREKMLKDIQSAGDKAVKNVEKEDDENSELKKSVTRVIQAVTKDVRALASFEQQVNSKALATSSAVLNLCVSSLRAHSDK